MPFLTSAKRTQDKETAVKHAGLRREIKTNTAAAKKATSPLEIAKQTILGIPKAGVDVARDVAKGAVEFAVSAGEAPVRLASPKASTAVLPKTKIPGLPFLGEVESFQNRAARAVRDEGASVPEAIAKGTLDVALNEPLGLAVKPLAVGGGLLLRAASKGGARLDLGLISKIVNGGKKAVVEEAAAPAARTAVDEFAGMSMAERLAATGERKLPVYGDTTPRPLPVAGISKTERVPIANDYRQTGKDIQMGAPGRVDVPTISANKPLPVQETPLARMQKLSPEDRKVVMRETRQLNGRGLDYKAAQVRALDAFEARSKPGDITFETLPEAPAAPVRTAAPAPVRESVPVPEKAPVASPAPVKVPVSRETAPVSTEIPPKTPGITKTEGEASIPKASTDINRKLAEKGFDEVPEAELAKFSSITKEDQIARVSRLMDADEDAVKLMASRRMPIPDGVHPQVLFNAVKKKAIEEGDVATMRDLARSPIATERATAAQTLGAAGFDNAIDDPVEAAIDIAKTRTKVAERQGMKPDAAKKGVAEAQIATKKVADQSWDDFIDTLTC